MKSQLHVWISFCALLEAVESWYFLGQLTCSSTWWTCTLMLRSSEVENSNGTFLVQKFLVCLFHLPPPRSCSLVISFRFMHMQLILGSCPICTNLHTPKSISLHNVYVCSIHQYTCRCRYGLLMQVCEKKVQACVWCLLFGYIIYFIIF